MGDFDTDMKAQMAEFRRSQATPAAKAKAKTGKAAIEYECEVSGIDMAVSRIVNGRCTMKLLVYLSQPMDDGRGTVLIKSMKDGAISDATAERVNTFLNGLTVAQPTGSETVPYLRSGIPFAKRLMEIRSPDLADIVKEGLINTDILDESEYRVPWYVPRNVWSPSGMGVSDRHPRLMRHMIAKAAEKEGCPFHSILSRMCSRHRTYSNVDPMRALWAFPALADVYDEPYARRCFDEFIDNERMGGLTDHGIRDLFSATADIYCWEDIVGEIKAGHARTTLDKNRLWNFIQHSVSVGMGKKINTYLGLYADYLRQSFACDGRVKDKYPEFLQVAHDIYSEKYTMITEFRDTQLLESRVKAGQAIIDQTHDGFQLKTLASINEFLEEARQNSNCVASYVDRVKTGKCWVASFRPTGSDSTVLTIEISPRGEMVQIKGKYNREPTKAELERLRPFQEHITEKMAEST